MNKTLAYNLVLDGYEVIPVYSFSMARNLIKDNYHLALLDINLPDGSGLDLCAETKERIPEIYIIFLTANDKESDMLKGYEVRAQTILPSHFQCQYSVKRLPLYLK